VPIGERRRPYSEGRTGFLRVDTVHQGDYDGLKGIYHINLVDELTQQEIIGTVPGVSKNFLIPLLEELIRALHFFTLWFHTDKRSPLSVLNYLEQPVFLSDELRDDESEGATDGLQVFTDQRAGSDCAA